MTAPRAALAPLPPVVSSAERGRPWKLTADQKDEIVTAHAAGVGPAALGRKYGVHPETIGQLLRRRRAGRLKPGSENTVDDFWARIEPEPNSGCWLWLGHWDRNNYGLFSLYGTTTTAHRLAYELAIGTIPDGKELDHLCRVRPCVNPRHLEPVDHLTNIRRSTILRVACRRGHPFDRIVDKKDANGRRYTARICSICVAASHARSAKRCS